MKETYTVPQLHNKCVDLKQISRSVVPLLIASLIVLLLITYIPGISTIFTA